MGYDLAHAECQERREGSSVLHEPVYQPAGVDGGFAYRGLGLLLVAVVPEGREYRAVAGFLSGDDGRAALVCVSSNAHILLARHRAG